MKCPKCQIENRAAAGTIPGSHEPEISQHLMMSPFPQVSIFWTVAVNPDVPMDHDFIKIMSISRYSL